MLWLPFGKDNSFINSYDNKHNMSAEELKSWSASQASVTNQEVIDTAINNRALGEANGIVRTLTYVAVIGAGVAITSHIVKKLRNKSNKKGF